MSGRTRVLLSALKEKWGCSIPYDHPLICYIVEHAGVLLNRFEVEVDGRTAYERNRGEKATTLGIGIGEGCCGGERRLEEHLGS